jgi:FemAB-related protein (PEP-CTERM system-associated)
MDTLLSETMTRYRQATEDDVAAWTDYVAGHELGTVFHLPAWSQAVSKCFPHKPLHLVAERDGKIVGLLPQFLVRSVFVGRVLVSIPYATYGGILADDDETCRGLMAEAERVGKEHNVQYVELRHRETRGLDDLPVLDKYDTFRMELPEREDQVVQSLPRKARAAARKGLRELQVDVERGDALMDQIYDLYAFTLRRLGSPNYPRKFFHALAGTYGDDCVGLVVRDGDQPVAGVVSYVFDGEIVPYFSGSLPDGMKKNANNAMYARLMEWAVAEGIRRFDFNRTRRDNKGPHSFKRNQGFEASPLHYQIKLQRREELPNLSPSNRKFALAGRIWQKLPLWFTTPVGAKVSSWIP